MQRSHTVTDDCRRERRLHVTQVVPLPRHRTLVPNTIPPGFSCVRLHPCFNSCISSKHGRIHKCILCFFRFDPHRIIQQPILQCLHDSLFTRRQRRCILRVSPPLPGKFALLTISISPRTPLRLFHPFNQAANTTSLRLQSCFELLGFGTDISGQRQFTF